MSLHTQRQSCYLHRKWQLEELNIGAEKNYLRGSFSSSEVEKISSEVNVPHPDVGKTVRKISACRGAKE